MLPAEKDYTATIMRVAGNLLSGVNSWLTGSAEEREAAVSAAVTTALLIAEKVTQRVPPGGPSTERH